MNNATTTTTRRRLLKGLGLGAAGLLAGCLSAPQRDIGAASKANGVAGTEPIFDGQNSPNRISFARTDACRPDRSVYPLGGR
jgi:hypothetical protein